MPQLSDEELIALLGEQLPDLLSRHPELEERVYSAFFRVFATKREVAAVLAELREFRGDVDRRFDAVDAHLNEHDQVLERIHQRFDAVDQRFEGVDQRFDALERDIQRQFDRFGARWGIRNESIFRETMTTLLEQSFGASVERRRIGGEEFDVVIADGAHILVEIAASVRKNILERLQRKREVYRQSTGVEPARIILAAGAIRLERADALRAAGFEVVTPEDEE